MLSIVILPQKLINVNTCNVSIDGVLNIRGDDNIQKRSMTAMVSAFARAYHSENNNVKIFNDIYARELLGDDYNNVASNMVAGIDFFNPTFEGGTDEALRWIVDNYLSPSPLGRAAFTERALQNAVSIGARQYLIFAAGYDSFAYRKPSWADSLSVFEIDHPATAEDKQIRLSNAGISIPKDTYYLSADFMQNYWSDCFMGSSDFSSNHISFCSLLGICYYLPPEIFRNILMKISKIIPKGSSIVFDYPDENSYTQKAGERAKKQAMLASGAEENMLASYSYSELEVLLSECGFLIYEHLTPEQITAEYFKDYNAVNPKHQMSAFDNVNYCLAVKNEENI